MNLERAMLEELDGKFHSFWYDENGMHIAETPDDIPPHARQNPGVLAGALKGAAVSGRKRQIFFSAADEDFVRRRRAAGASFAEIARQFTCSASALTKAFTHIPRGRR